jgi:hypothetical protein
MDTAVAKAAFDEFQKRMDSMYELADRLATLASGALALSVTFSSAQAAQGSIASWMLRISRFGFIATVGGFLLIHVAKIEMHKRLFDEIRAKESLDVSAAPRPYFHVGRHLLVWGFSIGLVFLAFFGVFAG